ncbi:MAG: hypothetical protein HFE81_05425 [Bacilli bacterium]|nr:hypothetical protein [Bacilli bacterium]
MENASKALIIAGAILLAILLITLGIVVYLQAQDTIDSVNMSEQEIMAFNNKFTPYEGDNVRGSQVNALIEAVVSNNQSAADNGDTATKGITVNGTAGVSIDPKTTSGTVKRVPSGTFYKVTITRSKSLVSSIAIDTLTKTE